MECELGRYQSSQAVQSGWRTAAEEPVSWRADLDAGERFRLPPEVLVPIGVAPRSPTAPRVHALRPKDLSV